VDAWLVLIRSPQAVQSLAWGAVVIGVLLMVYWLFRQQRQYSRIASIARQSKLTPQAKASRFDWVTSPISGLLSDSEGGIHERFVNAGIDNPRYAHLYMPLKYLVLGFGELMIAGVFIALDWSNNYWLACAGTWAMMVIALPDMLLATRAKNRQRRITRQMPYLIDLMAICVHTGMTIEASMKYLAIEMLGFDKEMAKLLDMVNHRARIVGMERSLEELYQKIPSSEMQSFVMTLTQSMQHGSSIYTMLTTLASDMREVQMLELVEQIGKLAAKMSIPLIVFILMPIVFVIAAPGVMRMMLHV